MATRSGQVLITVDSAEAAREPAACELASRLDLSIASRSEIAESGGLLLAVRDTGLELREPEMKPGHGMTLDLTTLDLRTGTGGLSRKQPIARAFGEKVRTILDATAGTGQDATLLAALGYTVTAVERSPILHAMLVDALARAKRDASFLHAAGNRLQIVHADARTILPSLAPPPDAVFIDPMFPPKRRSSALPRKEIQLLRRLVGDDSDADELFATATRIQSKRIVVKRPHHAPPLGGEPTMTFEGKLVRYDVYVK